MENAMRVVLFASRSFAEMSVSERTRACYQHSIMKYLDGDKMKNASLCERFGIDKKNAAQASVVIKKTLETGFIKVSDPEPSERWIRTNLGIRLNFLIGF